MQSKQCLTLSCYRSQAEQLQEEIPDARVVKAFNVLSAYTLENGGIQGSKEVNCTNKTYNSVIRDRKAVKTKVCILIFMPFKVKQYLGIP